MPRLAPLKERGKDTDIQMSVRLLESPRARAREMIFSFLGKLDS
jgi:hypothetical protein